MYFTWNSPDISRRTRLKRCLLVTATLWELYKETNRERGIEMETLCQRNSQLRVVWHPWQFRPHRIQSKLTAVECCSAGFKTLEESSILWLRTMLLKANCREILSTVKWWNSNKELWTPDKICRLLNSIGKGPHRLQIILIWIPICSHMK